MIGIEELPSVEREYHALSIFLQVKVYLGRH